MTDPKHIRDAYMHVARVNHYLVTVATDGLTWDELSEAEALLIRAESELRKPDKVIFLALDLCEQDVKKAMLA